MQPLKIGSFEILTPHWPPAPETPVILFIHGASLTKEFWRAQIEGLTPMVHPVSVDLPGHGGSEGKALDTVSGYAKAIMTFIREAKLASHALFLCGMSMGGGIVQQLLLDEPDRFTAAVLINTGARLKVHPMIFDSINKDFEGFVRSMPAFSLSPMSPVALYEHRILALGRACDAQTALTDFTACNTFDVMDRIPEITCKVLVLTAEHDTSTPSKYGVWLAENIPAAEHIHIKNAGHFSPMEKSEEINQALALFIDRCLA